MTEQFTVQLPDRTAQIVRAVAAQTGRKTDDVLQDLIDKGVADIPIESLPDAEVLALANIMMSEADGEELNDLLDDQQEGQLTPETRVRLDDLLLQYRQGMVQKSTAMRIAVERGLRPRGE